MRFGMFGCKGFASFCLALNLLSACADEGRAPAPQSIVDGFWATDCVARMGTFGSYRIALDFHHGRIAERTETSYSDGECQNPATSLVYSGRYELIVTLRDFVYGVDLFYENCVGSGGLPVPLKNLNLVQVERGHSLEFGMDIADENDRPLEIRSDEPQLRFLSQPRP